MKLFLDLDGVFADLAAGYNNYFGLDGSTGIDNIDWKLVENVPNFFAKIPMIPDALELWDYAKRFNPTILTGIPQHRVTSAASDKREWVAANLSPTVKVLTCHSRDKCLYANPGDVLVDDWTKYKDNWEAAQGVWITHTSAANSVAQLKALDALGWFD